MIWIRDAYLLIVIYKLVLILIVTLVLDLLYK